MKKVILIAIVIGVIYGGTYLVFKNDVEIASEVIADYEELRVNSFVDYRIEAIDSFNLLYPGNEHIFKNTFNGNDAEYYRDTVVSFFIYEELLEIKDLDFGYIDCVLKKSINDLVLQKNITHIEQELVAVKEDFENAENWIYKLGLNTFYEQQPAPACEKYYPDSYYTIVKPDGIKEFRRFLEELKQQSSYVAELSEQEQRSYATQLSLAENSLNNHGRKVLNEKLENRQVLFDEVKTFTFKSEVIGNIDYKLPSKVFDEETLATAFDFASIEQYRDYSLRTGAQPYADCYGRNRSCSDYGCSEIIVNTGSNDVVVKVKNRNGIVVRHAYINERSSYSFDMPNGSYQVFFYRGTGWNPNKAMKSSDCRYLRGGFVAGEHFGKGDLEYLANVQLSYTLIEQVNGNFRERASSKEEFF